MRKFSFITLFILLSVQVAEAKPKKCPPSHPFMTDGGYICCASQFSVDCIANIPAIKLDLERKESRLNSQSIEEEFLPSEQQDY